MYLPLGFCWLASAAPTFLSYRWSSANRTAIGSKRGGPGKVRKRMLMWCVHLGCLCVLVHSAQTVGACPLCRRSYSLRLDRTTSLAATLRAPPRSGVPRG